MLCSFVGFKVGIDLTFGHVFALSSSLKQMEDEDPRSVTSLASGEAKILKHSLFNNAGTSDFT